MNHKLYVIHRRIGRPIEIKGLKGQYIVYLALGLLGELFLFAVLYMTGVPSFLCLGLVLSSGFLLFNRMYALSRRYGEHGWMKSRAAKKLPSAIVSRTRKSFILQH